MNRAALRMSLLCAMIAGPASLAHADHIEKREYTIFINKRDSGRSWLHIVTKADGTEEVTGGADASFKLGPFGYSYKAETTEVWKDGRLTKLHTVATEDGKTTAIVATADGKQLLLQKNGKNSGAVTPEVWVSSYWKLADKKYHNNLKGQPGVRVPILDSDTGKEMSGFLQYQGLEPVKIGNKVEDCYFFTITEIPIPIKLWFDKHHRLVRQEFREKGYDTIIQLDAIRR